MTELEQLRMENDLLRNMVSMRDTLATERKIYEDALAKKNSLELENLQSEVNSLRNLLEFERNRYERIIASKDAGIARHLREKVSLDLDAMRETAKYLAPDDGARITRRLDRIEKVLANMGRKE